MEERCGMVLATIAVSSLVWIVGIVCGIAQNPGVGYPVWMAASLFAVPAAAVALTALEGRPFRFLEAARDVALGQAFLGALAVDIALGYRMYGLHRIDPIVCRIACMLTLSQVGACIYYFGHLRKMGLADYRCTYLPRLFQLALVVAYCGVSYV